MLASCRSLTGINGSSEGIVGVLVRGDTATALNISLGSVQVSYLSPLRTVIVGAARLACMVLQAHTSVGIPGTSCSPVCAC